MSQTVGTPLGKPGHRLVDADTHINEAPDLWTSRVSSKFKARVPHMESFDQGDAWVMEGVKDPINFGNNVAAGYPPEERQAWVRWDEIRRGGYDPKVRLEEMDMDLVDAAVLYPTPRISQLVIATEEPEFHLEMVKAYNDWLSEYCAHDPSRLGGIMLVPNRGVDDAVAEIERVIGRPGMVGCLIGCFPHGDLNLSEEDDPVWKTIADADVPLHIHVKLVDEKPTDIYAAGVITEGQAAGDLRFLGVPARMLQFLNAKVFDRVSTLKIVLAEVDAGWVPYVKEQVDNRLLRRGIGGEVRRQVLPSQVIEDHFWYTYITDHFAIRNRHAIGVDRLMWSSDFPHGGSDWPYSLRVIHADFADVPADERDLILGGNAQSLYKFGI
ncbi:MAG: amidohydrolase family protein [Acidimicrobiales bacterium]